MLVGLVKPWAVRRRRCSRLLVSSFLPLEARRLWCHAGILVWPGGERVGCVVELGQAAGLVEVAEPSERALVVAWGVEAVELL